MGSQFTAAWLIIATGEKDPRNLMIAFAVYRVVLIEFPITEHIEVRLWFSTWEMTNLSLGFVR
jgi:hypothetical protein